MPTSIVQELGMTWSEVWLTLVTATGIYIAMIALTRMFGQRQLMTTSSYDLAFVFAIGSVVGRVVLVRTSLATAVLGLAALFVLHAGTGWLHHNVPLAHRLIENRPILVVANGRFIEQNLSRAKTTRLEIYEQIRLNGLGSVEEVGAAVLERNGNTTILSTGRRMDADCFTEIVGREHLRLDGDDDLVRS
jgi:uncharacterized membrane protein YcaP (DUF421 family)